MNENERSGTIGLDWLGIGMVVSLGCLEWLGIEFFPYLPLP